MIRSYIFKLLRSPYLYAAMAGILGLCLFFANAELGGKKGLNGIDVCTDIAILLQVNGYQRFFIVLGAIPFAANFADEWNSKAIINCVTRKSAFDYAVSNVVVCFISTVVTIFVPLIVFAALDCGTKAVHDEMSGFDPTAYGVFQAMGLPFLTIVFVVLTYALSGAMWSVMGMTLSAFFPSRYIAIGAPFIFCNALERLTDYNPPLLSFTALTNGRTWISDGLGFCYTLLVFGGLSAVCGALFVMKVEKRVRNELG